MALDPLLCSLNRRLKGIIIRSIPVQGPSLEGDMSSLVIEERYVLFSYTDDVKPGVTDMDEVRMCISECDKLEGASGIKLHKNTDAGKIKLLPLGKWRYNIKQEDIPYNFIKISEYIDCVGVMLYANYNETRKVNGEALVEVRIMVNHWRSGKYIELLDRAASVNSNILGKLWYRAASVSIRQSDFKSTTKLVKQFIYQDLQIRPSDQALY